jgi:hypothetical protein
MRRAPSRRPPAAQERAAGARDLGARLAGPLAFPVALALDDDLIGVVGEAVDGGLREDRVIEQRDPLVDRPIAREERRRAPMALEDDLVEVARLARVEAPEAEVVDDQDVGVSRRRRALSVE